MVEVRSRPDINKSYQMKREYIPITERKQRASDYDEYLQKRREANPKSHEEVENCTFHPQISDKRQKKVSTNESVDRLLEWGKNKEDKRAKKMFENANQEKIYSYQPHLSSKSRKMTANRGKNGPAYERLNQMSKNKDDWILDQRKREQKGLFKPTICEKSRKMRKKKNDNLVKIENGQTESVAYYTAVPKGKLAKVPEASSKSKSRTRKKGKKGQRAKSPKDKLKFRPKKSRTPTKKKDRAPDYMSPYNPTVMSSDIPLTKILAKSKNHRKNLKNKKRNQRMQPNKSKSKSKSRAKPKRTRTGIPIKSQKDPLKFYKASATGKATPKKRRNISNLPESARSRVQTKSKSKSHRREFSTEIKNKNKRSMQSTKKKRARDLIYSNRKRRPVQAKSTKDARVGQSISAKSYKSKSNRSISKSTRPAGFTENGQKQREAVVQN